MTRRINLKQVREFTIEANPGDLTEEKLEIIQAFGVNRVSMGVQTFDDRLLKKIGRKHTAKEVDKTLNFLARRGFDNVSIDLIYALPSQDLSQFQATLKQALSYDLPHYSMYSLILENKTMFMNWVRQGRLELPTQEQEAQMFLYAIDTMTQAGYEHYEVSNFAKSGFQSQHNLVYWDNERYFGLGAGASGYLGEVRYRNFGPIQHYLKPLREGKLPIYTEDILDKAAQMEEEMFLGLWKKEGVDPNRFTEKYGLDFFEVYGKIVSKHQALGNLDITADGRIAMTRKGLFVGNDVFEDFLL